MENIEINERDVQAEYLKHVGADMERKALAGEQIMTVAEVGYLAEIFEKKNLKLDNIKKMGDMNKQANRVLEAFGGVDNIGALVSVVDKAVFAISKLNGGEIDGGRGDKINRSLLSDYIHEYITNSFGAETGGEFSFPLNAKLEKIVIDPDFFDKFIESGIDLQAVGFRIETVLSVLNRLMFACGGKDDADIKTRLNDPDFVQSNHGIPNRIFRGYERKDKEINGTHAEDIKVDISMYGEAEARKKIRHLPIGGLAVMMETLA